MAAISLPSRSQAASFHALTKRGKGNFASRNPGVVLVFCIVFLVALGVVSLFIYRRVLQKRAEREKFQMTEGP
ncbi:hypothetical protein N7478_012758 [Penicillium angulare]|uniref:uncharacterized protein n=1 Tax=Penicillium angulare TaxID=116970 RepID=UPI0025407C1C|nr:uncharacterized protein N7478_012758 [Penicillium angulare]KAJ5256654.1 hypothetical protein N7478_012758 [Penicillium angulare]